MCRKLLILFCINFAYIGAAEPKRIKEIRFQSASGQAENKMVLNYDSKGNITAISEFDKLGNLSNVQYYFYENKCLSKILKFRESTLMSRRLIIKTPDCQKILTIDKTPTGEINGYIQYVYENGYLKNLKEYSADHKLQMQASSNFIDGKLQSVDMEVRQNKAKMYYQYDSSNHVIQITIDSPPKAIISINYENGDATEESRRYIYE